MLPSAHSPHIVLEREIQKACLSWLQAKGIYAWRQNTAGVYDPIQKTFRTFHGLRGVADILGIVPQDVLCELEDKLQYERFGCLLAVEVKRPGKAPTNEQAAFLREINERGGIGICVHGIEELEAQLSPFLMS